MRVRIKIGKGVTGAVRYVMGPGHDPKTGHFLPAAGAADRVAWVGGSEAFGWKVENAADVDQARREMEFDALNQASKTKKCVYDCVHIVLAWERGEEPSREEMEETAKSQLKAQGMGNAKAIWAAHNDEDYFHLHIIASKINPETGRAYDLAGSWRKASAWAEEYEREHGGIIHVNRGSANELRRAIKERDVEGVLEAMTKRNATITAKQVERAVAKEIYPKIGASNGKKRSVELERAQFVNAILSHESVRRVAEKLEVPQPWMSAAGGLDKLSDEHRGAAWRSFENWREANPEAAARHGFADYVQYVQDKRAKEDHPREAVGLRYTTRSILDCESYVLEAAASLKNHTGHGVGEDRRAAVLTGKYGTMTAEQVHAFRHCTGEEGLAIIDGQAGTGKSFTLAAIRDAYEAEGHRVIGLAFTRKVVGNLTRDGFDASTIHKALRDLNQGRTKWDQKTVVMVDEAGMVDTKFMALVTAHARDAGAKLILVGDDRQISSIDHGGMFALLKKRHDAAVLSEVRRQYKADEARASEMMHEGNFDAALAIYEKKGAIHWTRTQVQARASLVEKWAADTSASPARSCFVFAYTNQDVDLLNVGLRAVRKERGELGADHSIKTAHGRFDFSTGDRVQFTGNDNRIGVSNGLTGTIEAIDGTHLAVKLADGKTINFDAASFQDFRHGYAGTVWKGQGDTLDQTYLYHSEHWRAAPSYVALTRHREQTDLFVATNTAEDLKALAKQVARQEETRAASAFYLLDAPEPVRPMTAIEMMAQIAGKEFERTAERMEREGRFEPSAWRQSWALHEGSLSTPQPAPIYRQDNEPAAEPAPAVASNVPAQERNTETARRREAPYSRWGDDEETQSQDDEPGRPQQQQHARRGGGQGQRHG
jgi:hypothetical protein